MANNMYTKRTRLYNRGITEASYAGTIYRIYNVNSGKSYIAHAGDKNLSSMVATYENLLRSKSSTLPRDMVIDYSKNPSNFKVEELCRYYDDTNIAMLENTLCKFYGGVTGAYLYGRMACAGTVENKTQYDSLINENQDLKLDVSLKQNEIDILHERIKSLRIDDVSDSLINYLMQKRGNKYMYKLVARIMKAMEDFVPKEEASYRIDDNEEYKIGSTDSTNVSAVELTTDRAEAIDKIQHELAEKSRTNVKPVSIKAKYITSLSEENINKYITGEYPKLKITHPAFADELYNELKSFASLNSNGKHGKSYIALNLKLHGADIPKTVTRLRQLGYDKVNEKNVRSLIDTLQSSYPAVYIACGLGFYSSRTKSQKRCVASLKSLGIDDLPMYMQNAEK